MPIALDRDNETWPLIFDARGATTSITREEVEAAVGVVDAIRRTSTISRGQVAMIADDHRLYARMLLYETLLKEIGIRSVRAFRQSAAAERWLDIMHAARYS